MNNYEHVSSLCDESVTAASTPVQHLVWTEKLAWSVVHPSIPTPH